jgi:hypothetical protein
MTTKEIIKKISEIKKNGRNAIFNDCDIVDGNVFQFLGYDENDEPIDRLVPDKELKEWAEKAPCLFD